MKAAIFDVDGTLIDSNDAHAEAFVEAFAEAGVKVAFDKVRPLIGMGGDKLIPAASGLDAESEMGKRVSERKTEIFRSKFLWTIKPFPKVRELFVALKEKGVRLSIASSANEDELDEFLEIAGIKDLVEKQSSADDADESKPAPDIVEATLAKLKLPKSEVVMIGDTPYDLEAATRAGIESYAFRTGDWSDDKMALASKIFDGPAEMLGAIESFEAC